MRPSTFAQADVAGRAIARRSTVCGGPSGPEQVGAKCPAILSFWSPQPSPGVWAQPANGI